MLRRHPENRWKLQFPTQLQAELLDRALGLAPAVVYATCSLARRENEGVVAHVTGQHDAGTTNWPGDALGGEGFYWAVIAR